MRQIIILIMMLGLIGCAGWTKTDKALLTINGVLMTVDMLQTADIYQHEEYYEINPVIDFGVGKFGTGFIPFYFAGSFGLRYLIADQLKSWRPWFLTGTAAVTAGLVIHNNSIGLKIGF